MRRSSLALIIGAAAIGWLAARQRRRIERLAVQLAVRQLAGQFDWDPLSWGSSIVNWVIGAGSRAYDDIKGLILKVVGDAFATLHNLLKEAVGVIDGAIEVLSHGLDTVVGWIGDADSWLSAHVLAMLRGFWGEVEPIVTGWLGDLRNWAGDALDALGRGLSAVIGGVATALDYVWHDLVDPVLNWIAHAADFVGHWVDVWWDAVWNATIGPALDLLAHVWGLVQQLWHFLTVTWVDVWHVLDKAWDWLIWLALHSWEDLVALFEGTSESVTPGAIRALASPDDRVLQLISDGFERIIG